MLTPLSDPVRASSSTLLELYTTVQRLRLVYCLDARLVLALRLARPCFRRPPPLLGSLTRPSPHHCVSSMPYDESNATTPMASAAARTSVGTPTIRSHGSTTSLASTVSTSTSGRSSGRSSIDDALDGLLAVATCVRAGVTAAPLVFLQSRTRTHLPVDHYKRSRAKVAELKGQTESK